jgi:hypothetical protein
MRSHHFNKKTRALASINSRSQKFDKKMRALASIPGNEKPEVVNKMRALPMPSIFSGAAANLETSRSEVGEVVSPFSPAA